MGHRRNFCTSQFSDMDSDRNWNHQHPDPRFNLENSTFLLPVGNAAVNGVNNMGCYNISPRSNNLNLSNFSTGIPNYAAHNSGLSHDTYPHPSSAGSSTRVLPNYTHHGPPCYDQFAIGGVRSNVNPQMDFGRTTFKRKIPSVSMSFDIGSTSGYHSAGSSSNLHASSYRSQPQAMSGSQCWPREPISMEPSYGNGNLLITGEGSQRNVRSRHRHPLHSEINSSGAHPSSNLPQHISAASVPGFAVAGQWSHPPVSLDSHRRIPSSGNSVASSSGMQIDGRYDSNPGLTRYQSTTLPTVHGPSTRGMGFGHSSYYGHRTAPYRSIPSYRPMGFTATVEDGRRTGTGGVALRHSRPLPIMGRSSERIGRARNIYGRFQPFSEVENARNRWVPEGVAMIDRSAFYDSNLFDQHRDMRLDIDNMSYEELLALGDRIGNVSTGLSEDTVSKCLTEMIYCSDQVQDEDDDGNCVICMEEYKDREGVGRLKCGHDFHSSCIKKWLLIKNVCPICKASAVEAGVKEK